MGPDATANNTRAQGCGGAMRDVLIWIARQFLSRILRNTASYVWNNFLQPCFSEMMACPQEDDEGDIEQDQE